MDSEQLPQVRVTRIGEDLFRVEWEPKVIVQLVDQVSGEPLSAPPPSGRPAVRYARAIYRRKREVGTNGLRRHLDRVSRHMASAAPGSPRATHYRRESDEGWWLLDQIAAAQG